MKKNIRSKMFAIVFLLLGGLLAAGFLYLIIGSLCSRESFSVQPNGSLAGFNVFITSILSPALLLFFALGGFFLGFSKRSEGNERPAKNAWFLAFAPLYGYLTFFALKGRAFNSEDIFFDPSLIGLALAPSARTEFVPALIGLYLLQWVIMFVSTYVLSHAFFALGKKENSRNSFKILIGLGFLQILACVYGFMSPAFIDPVTEAPLQYGTWLFGLLSLLGAFITFATMFFATENPFLTKRKEN